MNKFTLIAAALVALTSAAFAGPEMISTKDKNAQVQTTAFTRDYATTGAPFSISQKARTAHNFTVGSGIVIHF